MTMTTVFHDASIGVTACSGLVVAGRMVTGGVGEAFPLATIGICSTVFFVQLAPTRVELGRRLSLAIEFAVRSYIIPLAVAPICSELAMLGAVEVLRMAFNYPPEGKLLAAGSSPFFLHNEA